MQPFKKALSWLSGAAMLVGALIEVLQQTGIAFDPTSPVGKIILAAGVAVLFVRNLTEDKDGDGVPDVFQPKPRPGTGASRTTPSIAVLLALMSLGTVACRPVYAAPPRVDVLALGAPTQVDTTLHRAIECGSPAFRAANPDVLSCRWQITKTQNGLTAIVTVPNSLTAAIAFTGQPADSARYQVTAWTVARGLEGPPVSTDFWLVIANRPPAGADTLIVRVCPPVGCGP
jgi:hypothetical protein